MRKTVVFLFAVMALALPLSASQFIEMPFQKVVRDSTYIVRGTVGPVTSEWDSSREVIFSSATIKVDQYLGESGPQTLLVREVGGTVEGYRQDAIGFPELREGEEVILFLRPWEEGEGYRIWAFRQGKYVVNRDENGRRNVRLDDMFQGEGRPANGSNMRADEGSNIEEFESMVNAILRGARQTTSPRTNQ